MSKLRVGLVFGGRSTEHEVSVTSATTILKGLDPARYAPILIGIDHEGRWHVAEARQLLPEAVFTSSEAVTTFPSLGSGLELRALSDGGNVLGTTAVSKAMIDGFEAKTNEHLAERLMGALQAGVDAGGEKNPIHSAALLVVHEQP